MSAAPRVSVLLPVYNGGELLARSVRSVLAQTFTDFELIILDDGSTDDAVAALPLIGDTRLRVLGDRERRGLAARLNQGIDAARGTYIARMDADDLAFPERFARQVVFLDEHPTIDLLGTRAAVFREDVIKGFYILGLLPYAASHEDLCAQAWRGIPLPHPTWMARAAWFRRYYYFIPEFERAEDQELLLRAHKESRFACLDEVLLAYYQGEFDLVKTLTARRHLCAAHMRYFKKQRRYDLVLASLALTLARIAVDLVAANPGVDEFFFRRMRSKVPADIIKKVVLLRNTL